MNDDNKKTILLVEDEVLVAMSEKIELEEKGYIVHHVTTGEDAVKAVLDNARTIDLILMDIDLGSGIDGTQAAEKILNHADIPVVFLSSRIEPEVVEKTEKITSYGYVVKESGIVVLDTSIKMALRLFDSKLAHKKKAEELRESDYKYRMLFENMNVSFALHEAIYDENGNPVDYRYLEMNPKFLDNLGSTASAIRGHTARELFPNTEQYWIDTFGNVAKTGKSVSFQNYSRELNQWFNTFVFSPKKNQFASFFIDITDQKMAEENYRMTIYELKKSQEVARVGSWVWHISENRVEWSDEMYRIFGIDKEQFTGDLNQLVNDCIHPDDRAEVNRSNASVMKQNTPIPLEYRIIRPDGSVCTVWAEAGELMLDEAGNPMLLRGIVLDITDRKQAEEEIKKQLSEKETLLQEVHHRVKNNIANIEGLLSLQADTNSNPEVKAALQDSISRVQSMRVLYEKLLVSKEPREISMKDYAEDLIDSLHDVFACKDAITIEKSISDFEVNAKKAITIGIIINELMTNVFKYAFKDRNKGAVFVSIEKNGKKVTIIIQDDGVGIDEKIMGKKSTGFGLTIIKMLVDHLDGTYSIVNKNGTRSVLQFEL